MKIPNLSIFSLRRLLGILTCRSEFLSETLNLLIAPNDNYIYITFQRIPRHVILLEPI